MNYPVNRHVAAAGSESRPGNARINESRSMAVNWFYCACQFSSLCSERHMRVNIPALLSY